MEEIKVWMAQVVAMVHAAYGDIGIKFLHVYLDENFPESGAANNNVRAARDLRPPSVQANDRMRLHLFFRDSGGREIHIEEISRVVGYSNPQHRSYDLREMRAKGTIWMVRRGFYRLVRAKAVA